MRVCKSVHNAWNEQYENDMNKCSPLPREVLSDKEDHSNRKLIKARDHKIKKWVSLLLKHTPTALQAAALMFLEFMGKSTVGPTTRW